MESLPYLKKDGTYGLLYYGKLGEYVEKKFPLLDVSQITDHHLLTALFRDYTILQSAYLLEDCFLRFLSTGSYGLAKDLLPMNISIPLHTISKKLQCAPWMDYARTYVLSNFKRKDPN